MEDEIRGEIMKRLTQRCSDALKGIFEREGWFMEEIEYPHLFRLIRRHGGDEVADCVEEVVINVRGKTRASFWMKGKREEFGIPLREVIEYDQWSNDIKLPLYFFILEDSMNMISYIYSEDAFSKGRIWEKDDVDVGGSLFVPKRSMIPYAELDVEGKGVTRYINRFSPKRKVVMNHEGISVR